MKAKAEGREPAVFEHFSGHTMRHTFATRALENGIPTKVVQELLGHSTIKTTMDIYTHVLLKTKNEEIKKQVAQCRPCKISLNQPVHRKHGGAICRTSILSTLSLFVKRF